MRSRHCNSCGEWHPLDEWPAECSVTRFAPSHGLACPMIVNDNISPSEIGGRTYTSKRAWQKEVAAHGLEIVGTETKCVSTPKPKAAPDTAGVRESIQKAFAS